MNMKNKSKGIAEIMEEKERKGVLTGRATEVKQQINEEFKEKFLKPDFSKEISKHFNLRLSPYQAEILTKLAYSKHNSKQQVIIEAIYNLIEKEGLIEYIITESNN